MQELRFISADDNGLIVSDDGGQHYRLVVDDALRDALRPRPHVRSEAPKVAPREIQQLIRAGRTAEQVVELTGADPDDVERFEGPVLAERAHIVEQARLVTVRVHPDLDPLDAEPANFGGVIDERLESLGATNVRWDGWKDPEHGWRVGLEFCVDGLERDALWAFDPRSHALSPQNPSAITLSQQGELASLQAPRLRAVDPVQPTGPVSSDGDATSDGGTRDDERTGSAVRTSETRGAAWLGAAVAEIGQRSDAPRDETADLLEQLRRRRGEREPHLFDDADDVDIDDGHGELVTPAEESAASPVTPFSSPARERAVAQHPSAPAPETAATPSSDDETFPHGDATGRGNATGPVARKRGRPTLPSWDEIVFGTRSDDDRN